MKDKSILKYLQVVGNWQLFCILSESTYQVTQLWFYPYGELYYQSQIYRNPVNIPITFIQTQPHLRLVPKCWKLW